VKTIKLIQSWLFLFGFLLLSQPSIALATSVDPVSICDLEGYPGDTIITHCTITGDETETRTGYWDNNYKKVEGDSSMMDITSWITIEPKQYIISHGEIKSFNIIVKIPEKAGAGLWGATSKDAGLNGQSSSRRTYIIFRDTLEGGNVYSGMLIPVSVKVLGTPNPFTPILTLISQNLVVTIMAAVIVFLAIMLFIKMRPKGVLKS
jgi:hypothetical protein